MNYTVKKVTKGEEINYTEINVGCIKGIQKVWSSNGWVVVDENENPIITTSRLTGEEVIEIYGTKKTARKVAEFNN